MVSEKYLKTLQVAQALGVSVSTVKRWVDLGTIHAVRTAGKHRLIPFSEAVRLAHQLGMSESDFLYSVENSKLDFDSQCSRLCDQVEQLLRAGACDETRRLIRSMHASGWTGAQLADRIVSPVLARLGHSWKEGSLDIHQEHEASQILVKSAVELLERVTKAQTDEGPLALGATVEGDTYVLSSLFGELVLRELGWRVRNFGMNLPLPSLAKATLQYRPRMVFLSINYLADEERFLCEYRAFHEVAACADVAVIVGGHALKPRLRNRMVYASFGDQMAHLAEFAKRLSVRSTFGSLDERNTVIN